MTVVETFFSGLFGLGLIWFGWVSLSGNRGSDASLVLDEAEPTASSPKRSFATGIGLIAVGVIVLLLLAWSWMT